MRVNKIINHTTRPIGHYNLLLSLLIIWNGLGSKSRRGIELDLDQGEVQVWEQKDSLLTKVLKVIPLITSHFIKIGLGPLILLNGLLLHLLYILMQHYHLRFQVGILLH